MYSRRIAPLCALALGSVAAVGAGAAISSARKGSRAARTAGSGCRLNSARGNIKHVIYVQFDNTHFLRENPNVPSHLEQMPNLLNFLRQTGTLPTNDHTRLISHTAPAFSRR